MPSTPARKNGLAQARRQREAALEGLGETKGYTILAPGSEPPKLVELTGKAYEYWRYMVDEAPEGHFAVTDAPLLANYCRLLARSDQFTERIGAEPLTIDTEYGERINPYWSGYLKMQTMIAQINARLRLAPGSRQATIAMNDPAGKQKNKTNRDGKPAKQPKSRAHLLFGGARLTAQMMANEDADNGDE